ncbi:MAG: putative bifunctional diguanylate cyclase/phosphodiesterase, partial [Polyangiaceae bacterium]
MASVRVCERRGHASPQVEVAAAAERRISQERLLFSFYHDEVTGLPNRTYWRELVRIYLEASRDRAESAASVGFSVMCVDLDNFKDVNDTLGYTAGDAVLVEAATRLRACLRSHDVIGRLGGDEFAVLLPDLRDPGEIRIVANRLLEKLRAPFAVSERTFDLGCSIGIACYSMHGRTVEDLLQHADIALHHAKRDGRNCHRVYVPEMVDANDARRTMKQALVRALAGDEFTMHYQPLLDLRTGRCEGAEALIRWNDPEKGLVMPGHFIAVAEETD